MYRTFSAVELRIAANGAILMSNLRVFFASLVLVIVCVPLAGQSGGTFTITKSVSAGGGGTASGGTFSMDGTIGQPLAGTTSNGGTFSLQSGFWAGGSTVA